MRAQQILNSSLAAVFVGIRFSQSRLICLLGKPSLFVRWLRPTLLASGGRPPWLSPASAGLGLLYATWGAFFMRWRRGLGIFAPTAHLSFGWCSTLTIKKGLVLHCLGSETDCLETMEAIRAIFIDTNTHRADVLPTHMAAYHQLQHFYCTSTSKVSNRLSRIICVASPLQFF